MRFLVALAIAISFLLHPSLGQANLCRKIMGPSKLSKELNWYDVISKEPTSIKTQNFLINTHEVDAQSRQSIDRNLFITTYEYDGYFVEIMRPDMVASSRQHFKGKPTDVDRARAIYSDENWRAFRGWHATEGLKVYFTKIFETLDFVFKHYHGRKHWPPSFLAQLTNIAFRYMMLSTYINVRVKNADGTSGGIVGSIRLISAPFQKDATNHHASTLEELALLQPVSAAYQESSLNLKSNNAFWADVIPQVDFFNGKFINSAELIPTNDMIFVPTPLETVFRDNSVFASDRQQSTAGQIYSIVEPGNFAIDRRHNRWAIIPLMFHIARLSQSHDASFTLGLPERIVTYAEPGSPSWQHYTELGFTVSKQMTDDRGMVWDILTAYESGLVQALRKRLGMTSLPEMWEMRKLFDTFDAIEAGKLTSWPPYHQ